MDHHAFSLVKPISRVLDAAAHKYFSLPNIWLGGSQADYLQSFALHDYVHHADVLRVVSGSIAQYHKRQQQQHGTDSSSSNVSSSSSSSSRPFIPLYSVKRLLHAVQRFPHSVTQERDALALDIIRHVELYVSPQSLDVAEMQQLWALVAMTPGGERVQQELLDRFPLVDTLPLQTADDFMETLTTITTSRRFSEREQVHSLLTRCFGEAMVWHRCEDALRENSGKQQQRHSPLERVMPLIIMTSYAMGTWPSALFPDEEASWSRIMGEAITPTTPPQTWIPALHSWTQQIGALHAPGVPAYARHCPTLHEALARNLWHLCTAKDVESVVQFLFQGLPVLQRTVPDTDWRTILEPYASSALRLHLPSSSGLLTAEAYVSLALLASTLHCDTEQLHALWVALAARVQSLTQSQWQPMMTAYLLVAMEHTDAQMDAATQAWRHELLARCKQMLTPGVVEQHGTARLVYTLLHDAPVLTAELGLEQKCVALLNENIECGGFSRAQLEALDAKRGSALRLDARLQDIARGLPQR